MSCGRPHDAPCDEVLGRVYEYLDHELDQVDVVEVRRHLAECGPCLAKFGLEQAVKDLVRRSCGQDAPPEGLRAKVLVRIQQVRVDIGSAGLPRD
jgi:mycothiol system anti-sigma-R factor